MRRPEVRSFLDPVTYTVTHVVIDPATERCAIVDSVHDYDPKSGRTACRSLERVVVFVRERGLGVDWILETHVHADHLSAAPGLQAALGGRTAIGAHVSRVQGVFAKVFNAGADFAADGSQWDCLLADGDRIAIGELEGYVMHTPGHTPACVTYVFGDAAFIGDTLFAPDFGSARCDFPGGDARALYRSARRILALPETTRLFLCHDYLPGDREAILETTVTRQRRENVHLHDGVEEEAFVRMRTERDAGLEMPVLILPSVQVNIRAGDFPPPEDNGIRYLKIPVNTL